MRPERQGSLETTAGMRSDAGRELTYPELIGSPGTRVDARREQGRSPRAGKVSTESDRCTMGRFILLEFTV